jgi:hypothetical protein
MSKCIVTNCKKPVLMDEKCCNHLKQQCSICLEMVSSMNSSKTKRLLCGHSFHYECISEWFVVSDICPVCRYRSCYMEEPLLKYKNRIEDNLRNKYKDVLESNQTEIRRLEENLKRYTEYYENSEHLIDDQIVGIGENGSDYIEYYRI